MEVEYRRKNEEIECVVYKDCKKSYPAHTHAKHLVLGTVEEGRVRVVKNGEEEIYEKGEQFTILPNDVHEMGPVEEQTYSLEMLCIRVEERLAETPLERLWEEILENPENKLLIDDMGKVAGMSQFHLIRQFKKAYGLTPHQFQIQCRVRKAQKMLENGQSVLDTAYDMGFCDESHIDRCFQRVVGMTPSEYIDSVEDID